MTWVGADWSLFSDGLGSHLYKSLRGVGFEKYLGGVGDYPDQV